MKDNEDITTEEEPITITQGRQSKGSTSAIWAEEMDYRNSNQASRYSFLRSGFKGLDVQSQPQIFEKVYRPRQRGGRRFDHTNRRTRANPKWARQPAGTPRENTGYES